MPLTVLLVASSTVFVLVGWAACGSDRASTDVVTPDAIGDSSEAEALDSASAYGTDVDALVSDDGEVDGEVEAANSDSDDADVFDCSTPRETCPCDFGVAQPCCLRVSEGLECARRRLPSGEFIATWQRFFDCGCMESPDCGPSYDLCPLESRGF